MRFFWSFIAGVYSTLVISGCKIAPPKWLFNKPKIKVPVRIAEVIHADTSFTAEERQFILTAAKDLEFFTNDWFTFDIKFDLDVNEIDAFLEESILLRADGYNSIIQEADQAYNNNVIGLCRYWEDGNRDLYLVYDRLHDPISWRTTAIHELGHFIGLCHTDKHSIMFKKTIPELFYTLLIKMR